VDELSAAARWANELAAWAIPDHILAQAPESPWGYVPKLFRAGSGAAGSGSGVSAVVSLASERAREGLDPGATVLDVGCGGGAAAFALVPPAGRVIGVDESPEMLELFRATATARGVQAETIEGRWPEVAIKAPVADVVVCHNVFYNVAGLATFALALTAHTQCRVVAELTARHPLTRQRRLWQHFWSLERPDGPSAELALAVLREAGLPAYLSFAPATDRDGSGVARAELVAFVRRRLCLTAERDPEIDELLGDEVHEGGDRAVIWWDRPA
jgi:SAM-dependent methyltransferase